MRFKCVICEYAAMPTLDLAVANSHNVHRESEVSRLGTQILDDIYDLLVRIADLSPESL